MHYLHKNNIKYKLITIFIRIICLIISRNNILLIIITEETITSAKNIILKSSVKIRLGYSCLENGTKKKCPTTTRNEHARYRFSKEKSNQTLNRKSHNGSELVDLFACLSVRSSVCLSVCRVVIQQKRPQLLSCIQCIVRVQISNRSMIIYTHTYWALATIINYDQKILNMWIRLFGGEISFIVIITLFIF